MRAQLAFLAAMATVISARPALALTEASVLHFVRSQAAQKYQVSLKDVSVQWKGAPLSMIAHGLPEHPHLELGSVYTLSGTMPVPIEVWDKGKQITTIFPELEVDVWEKVLVASTYIPMGQPVSSSDVKIERRVMSMLGSQPLTSMRSLGGAVAARDIPPGMVLIGGMTSVPPLIRSGTMVNVKLVVGGLTILTTGQAMQDGRDGQAIRVLNPASNKDYTGVVVGRDAVVVNLEAGEDDEP